MNNNSELILKNNSVLSKLRCVFLTSVSVIENEPINHFHLENKPINVFFFHIKIS